MKCKSLFLMGLMMAVSGCCDPNDPVCYDNHTRGIGNKCIENVKKSAVPCVNNDDIATKLAKIK